MTIWWVPSHWHSVTLPLKNPGYAYDTGTCFLWEMTRNNRRVLCLSVALSNWFSQEPIWWAPDFPDSAVFQLQFKQERIRLPQEANFVGDTVCHFFNRITYPGAQLQAMGFIRAIDLGDNHLVEASLHTFVFLNNSVWINFVFHVSVWTFPQCLFHTTFSPTFRIFDTSTRKHNSLSPQGLTHETTAQLQKCWLRMNLINLFQLVGNFDCRENKNPLPMSTEFLFSDSFFGFWRLPWPRKHFRVRTSDFGLRTSNFRLRLRLRLRPVAGLIVLIDGANSNRSLHHILQDYFYQEYSNFVIKMAFLVVVRNIPDASIQLSPAGEVNSGGYIPRREASRYISTALERP